MATRRADPAVLAFDAPFVAAAILRGLPRARYALAVALASVGVAGCKDAGKDDVTRTVKTYYLAVSRGDARTACHQLARDFRRAVRSGHDLLGEVDRRRCAVIYGPARRFFDHPLGEKDLDVEVSLSENRAGATV